MGPSPNKLVLGFLEHSLASQVVSHTAVLAAIARFEAFNHPHCLSVLMDLLGKAKDHVTSKGRPEDCVQLSVSLLNAIHWLLRLLAASLETLKERKHSQIHRRNVREAVGLLKHFAGNDFNLALLYVGRAEDKAAHAGMLATVKKFSSEMAGFTATLDGEGAQFRTDMTKVLSALKTFEPEGGKAESGVASYTLSIQPLLAFEALLHPGSDVTGIAHKIFTVAINHGLSYWYRL